MKLGGDARRPAQSIASAQAHFDEAVEDYVREVSDGDEHEGKRTAGPSRQQAAENVCGVMVDCRRRWS